MRYMAAKKKPKFIDVRVIGKKGGEARAASLSQKELSESARNAVNARWKKVREAKAEKSGEAK